MKKNLRRKLIADIDFVLWRNQIKIYLFPSIPMDNLETWKEKPIKQNGLLGHKEYISRVASKWKRTNKSFFLRKLRWFLQKIVKKWIFRVVYFYVTIKVDLYTFQNKCDNKVVKIGSTWKNKQVLNSAKWLFIFRLRFRLHNIRALSFQPFVERSLSTTTCYNNGGKRYNVPWRQLSVN